MKHWMAVRAYSSPTIIQRQLSGSCLFYKEFGRGDNKNGCQKQKDMSIMFAEEKKGEKYLCCMKKSILETVDTEQGIQF